MTFRIFSIFCSKDMKNEAIKTMFASNQDAKSLELTGTPAFFVIGPDGKTTRLFGAQPYETFEQVFENELEK